MARDTGNDDWGFEDDELEPRPTVQPRYGRGARGGAPKFDRGQLKMRGTNDYNAYEEYGNEHYENRGFANQGQGMNQGYNNYNYNNQGHNEGETHEGSKEKEKEKKAKGGFKKVVTLVITLVVTVVLLFVAVKLVKGTGTKNKSTGAKTTQTSKYKTVNEDTSKSTTSSTDKGSDYSKEKAVDQQNVSIKDVGGTKDSSAKEKIDVKSIESDVYSNTATVKSVELITTGKLTASYHFVFEMGSTHLDMYLNEFEAENLKVGDKVKISFKKIPSKDKVVITDIQRA